MQVVVTERQTGASWHFISEDDIAVNMGYVTLAPGKYDQGAADTVRTLETKT